MLKKLKLVSFGHFLHDSNSFTLTILERVFFSMLDQGLNNLKSLYNIFKIRISRNILQVGRVWNQILAYLFHYTFAIKQWFIHCPVVIPLIPVLEIFLFLTTVDNGLMVVKGSLNQSILNRKPNILTLSVLQTSRYTSYTKKSNKGIYLFIAL